MIHEIAQISIDPAEAAAFEAAAAQAVQHFRAAKDCLSMRVDRTIEQPGHYLLVVGWETVEAHTETFRSSSGYAAWRGLVGRFFIEPPSVTHVQNAVAGF